MKAEPAEGKSGFRDFRTTGIAIYRGNDCHRATESSLEKLLICGPTAFHLHAKVRPFILTDRQDRVGRFALIHDDRLPEYVQISFFEAFPGLGDILTLIRDTARRIFPRCSRIIAGLNGHLNYGAGFLLNRFDEPPVFGLPYTHPWYPAYFNALGERKMTSYRFTMDEIQAWAGSKTVPGRLNGLRTRFMDKKKIKSEISVYTRLNNGSFPGHPYWSDRSESEDFELFSPFRHLLDNENLVFAEINGEPAGFFLWYPDFNQLVTGHRDLGLPELIRYRLKSPIDAFRFTEIGILPQYRRSHVAFAMIRQVLPVVAKAGYRFCEAGFIFEENRDSTALALRMVSRSFGTAPRPYRRYAVYDGKL